MIRRKTASSTCIPEWMTIKAGPRPDPRKPISIVKKPGPECCVKYVAKGVALVAMGAYHVVFERSRDFVVKVDPVPYV